MIIIILFLAIVSVALMIYSYNIWQIKEMYRKRVFELTNGKEGSNIVNVIPETPPPAPPVKPILKRYVRRWKFINLDNSGDNQTLNKTVASMISDGYEYIPSASVAGVLAFVKYECEIK